MQCQVTLVWLTGASGGQAAQMLAEQRGPDTGLSRLGGRWRGSRGRIEGEDMQLVKERGRATMGLSDGSAGD